MLQASHCSTFRIMCDVPSTAVFCSESIECFPGTASIFFLKLLVTIPVAPIITGILLLLLLSIYSHLLVTRWRSSVKARSQQTIKAKRRETTRPKTRRHIPEYNVLRTSNFESLIIMGLVAPPILT